MILPAMRGYLPKNINVTIHEELTKALFPRSKKHIDGLSGEEEYLALQECGKKGGCPNCGADIHVHQEYDGPDDYTTEGYCTSCKWST